MMLTEQRLLEAYAAGHPRDVARRMEVLAESDATEILASFPAELAGSLLPALPVVVSARLLARLSASAASQIVACLDQDLGAAILRDMADEGRLPILGALPEARARALRILLRYPEGTAGSLMDPSVLGFDEHLTVAEALERVHRNAAHVLYYVYATDGSGLLSGVASLRQLMLADPEAALSNVVIPRPSAVSVSAGAAAITAHPAWERFFALPVVDGRRFVGVLRYKVMRRLERGLSAHTPDEQAATTRAALAELFGLSLAGLTEWAAAATRGPAMPGDKP